MSEQERAATRVGFIGLGSQGGPMARRISEEGYPLTIWARRTATLDEFRDTPAHVASTPAELGRASDVVAVCVVADADVEDVLLRHDGVLAGMAPGGIIAIHSTIHPDTCRTLADRAAQHDVMVVDAPVSGGGIAASQRKLLVMVGGEPEPVARCLPIFETYAEPVIHLGALGSGQMAKLLNNFVFTAQITVALETFSFAERLGMDRNAFAQVLAAGSGESRAAAIIAMTQFDTSGIGGAAPLLRKDMNIMLDVAAATRSPAPPALVDLARSALETLEQSTRDR